MFPKIHCLRSYITQKFVFVYFTQLNIIIEREKYPDLARELKRMVYESDGDTFVIGALGTVRKGLILGLRREYEEEWILSKPRHC